MISSAYFLHLGTRVYFTTFRHSSINKTFSKWPDVIYNLFSIKKTEKTAHG